MSQYKELADRLQKPGPGTAEFYEACDKAAAILRSLDAQPVAVYHGRCVENGHSDVEMLKMIPAGTKLYAAPVAAQPQQAKPLSDAQPRLRVRLQSFPESNGKRNWTALLCREDENFDGLVGNCGGIQIARGELWNRVAYHAEEARFLIGERDTEPHILDYGDDIETPEQWAGEVRNGIKEQG